MKTLPGEHRASRQNFNCLATGLQNLQSRITTGARWSLSGAEAVLRLRSLRSSRDFDEYWEFHLQQEHEHHHRKLYADGEIPEPESAAKADARGGRLWLVNDSAASS